MKPKEHYLIQKGKNYTREKANGDEDVPLTRSNREWGSKGHEDVDINAWTVISRFLNVVQSVSNSRIPGIEQYSHVQIP